MIKSKPIRFEEANTIGKRIRYYRLKKGMAQWQLANECFMCPGTISNLEIDVRSPTIDTLISVAKALNVKTIDLIPPEIGF